MPTVIQRFSSAECWSSGKVELSGSSRTVAASPKVTPCFLRLLAALLNIRPAVKGFAEEIAGMRMEWVSCRAMCLPYRMGN